MKTDKVETDLPEAKALNQLHYLGVALCISWIITLDPSSPDLAVAAPYFGIIAAALGLVVNQRVSYKLASWLFIAPTFAASLWANLFFGGTSFAPHLILVSFMGLVAFQSPKKSRIYAILAVAAFLISSLLSPQYALIGLTRSDIDAFLTRPNAGLAESLLLTYIILCLYVLATSLRSQFTENLSRRAQFLQERFESARNRFLAQTAIHRFLPRALLVLDQTDRIIGASYVFLSKAGMSLKSVEGKRLSDILRSPANVDIDLDQKSALVNFTTAIDAAPALAKIHTSTILGRKLQTVLDIEFPRAEEQFKGAATGYIGDIQTAQHIFNRYLQQENTVDTRTVIRLRCTEYPALLSRFGKSVADDALMSYLERLPKSGVQATLRLSGSTTAVLLSDSEAHETVIKESKQRLFNHTIRIFEEEWQIEFELTTLRSPLDFTDSRSFCAAGNTPLIDSTDAVLRERVLKQISDQGFLFHFQPIHRCTASHEVLFCEGLARWNGSDPLPPPVFIDIASQLGLGRAMTKSLITAFCKAYEQLNRQSGSTQTVSFNMSALDIQDETLRNHLKSQVAAFRLNPTNIVIELIETQRIKNITSFVANLQDLSQHGFKVAIDDFGKAFSSIERLMQIPFDYLKLDGSLCSAKAPKNSATLLRMIVNLGQELNVPVIAEAIEDEQDLKYINGLGILWSQGYLFSRPADPAATATMLKGVAMLDTSAQIARTQKESLRKALLFMSWGPAVTMLIFIPILILRPEWTPVSTGLTFAGLILGATRLYVWITNQALSNVYLIFTIFVLLTYGALGFYGYGPTTAAIPSTFLAVVAGNLIFKRKRDRRLLTASTCLILISIGSYNAQEMITIAPPVAWYSLSFGNHQSYLLLAASLAGMYLVYRLAGPFQVATSQLEALLAMDAEEVSKAEVSAELVHEMYRNIPGITIELDDADRIVMLSREAEACLKLSDNSALGHYSETRLISVTDIDLMIHGTDTSRLKTAVTVDTPWSDSPQRLEVSSILGPSQARHKILTFAPLNQINQKLGQFITQQLQELVTIDDDKELYLAVFNLDIYSAKTSRMLNDIQRIANGIGAEFPLVCEATHTDNLLCAVVSADQTKIAHAIELMRELHALALAQNLKAAAGYFTDKLASEDLESFISKSQIAIEIAQESADSSFIEYNQEMYGNWDPSVRASMLHAIKNEEITLKPHEIQRSRPTLPKLADLRLEWGSAITEKRPKHLSLYEWLAAYDLIKEHPINDPKHAVLRSTEFFAQNLDTSLIYTLPDQLVLDLTQFQRFLDALSQTDRFTNRMILAIREETAARLSLEHWQIARQMQTHGVRLALSDIGTGDSDLSLLGNELFDFLCISAELTELGFTSEKNTVVLKNLLNLAQTLGKPTIVCTEPSHTHKIIAIGADYISLI